jgi:hypothetical protein
MPTEEDEDKILLRKCALTPIILKTFYERYQGAKFPRDDIAKNVLTDLGVPIERNEEALKIVRENGYFVGILVSIKDGIYIELNNQDYTQKENTQINIDNELKINDENKDINTINPINTFIAPDQQNTPTNTQQSETTENNYIFMFPANMAGILTR